MYQTSQRRALIDRRTAITSLMAGALGCAPARLTASAMGGSRPTIPLMPSRAGWERLDAQVSRWWDQDLITSLEEDVRADPTRDFLPFPYLSISPGKHGLIHWQFPVDTAFTNLALMEHKRLDIARSQILNQLFLIERFGFPPNSSMAGRATRSQLPFFVPGTIWRYYRLTGDKDLLCQAYPLLKKEYEGYWNASHHQTPIGLSTNRDLGDKALSPVLASEAEVLDWMPVFAGDVRRCAPLATNVGLVRHAQILANMADVIGRPAEAASYRRKAGDRAALIRHYCWDEATGLFLEYDYVAGRRLPYISEFSWWPLWGRVATRHQARRLAANISLIEKPYGLAVTDRDYPDPHKDADYILSNGANLKERPPLPGAPPQYVGGRNPLQWMCPAGWATTQMILSSGFDIYGFAEEARRIAARFTGLLIDQFEKTGELWEKYNVVDGSLILPNARYGNTPYHAFSAAAVVLLGRRTFMGRPVELE